MTDLKVCLQIVIFSLVLISFHCRYLYRYHFPPINVVDPSCLKTVNSCHHNIFTPPNSILCSSALSYSLLTIGWTADLDFSSRQHLLFILFYSLIMVSPECALIPCVSTGILEYHTDEQIYFLLSSQQLREEVLHTTNNVL